MDNLLVPAPVVSVEWLRDNIYKPEIMILDGSWYMPASNRNGFQEYLEECLPKAQFFDFDKKIKALTTTLPHMLPSVDNFCQEVKKLGIKTGQALIVYDGAGLFSAARVWWMFKVMGYDNVAILDGGLPAWKRAAYPVEKGSDQRSLSSADTFVATLKADWLADWQYVFTHLYSPKCQILDARSKGRFLGLEPEPREGLPSGHMPRAKNLPFTELLDDEGYLLPKETLARIFSLLLTPEKELVVSCGSGVTSAILALVAFWLGYPKIRLYDGSWTEWAEKKESPIQSIDKKDSKNKIPI